MMLRTDIPLFLQHMCTCLHNFQHALCVKVYPEGRRVVGVGKRFPLGFRCFYYLSLRSLPKVRLTHNCSKRTLKDKNKAEPGSDDVGSPTWATTATYIIAHL